tara:strand:+ start:339 stop:656 length:318 start_codon:yes stop_codon:yes gene_type:complete
MAITNFTKLEQTINRSTNNAPSLGCGGVKVQAGETLPPGDYVALKLTGGATLNNFTFNGVGVVDVAGADITIFKFVSGDFGTYMMNINSCTHASGDPVVFYRRCR